MNDSVWEFNWLIINIMPKLLSIIIHPDPILRTKARALTVAEIKQPAMQTLARF